MARIQIPYETKPQTRPTDQGLAYLQPSEIDYSGITRGLSIMAQSLDNLGAEYEHEADREAARKRVEEEQIKRSKLLVDMDNWRQGTDDLYSNYINGLDPTDTNAEEAWDTMYTNRANEFRSRLTDPIQQAEFDQNASGWGREYHGKLRDFQGQQRATYSETVVDDQLKSSKQRLVANPKPDTLVEEKRRMNELIELQTNMRPVVKDQKKKQSDLELNGIMYGEDYRRTHGIRPRDPDTPPEAPGMITVGNIDLTKRKGRPIVGGPLKDSRYEGTSAPIEATVITHEGHFIVVPTIDEDGKKMNAVEVLEKYAKNGEHLGIFATKEQAESYANRLEDWTSRNREDRPYYEPDSPQASIEKRAAEFGVRSIELAAVLSRESMGTFSTGIYGGVGNTMLGVWQANPDNQRRYGVRAGQPFDEQMAGLAKYLKDNGYKPEDYAPEDRMRAIYSTILSGHPDSPGTLADKNGTIDWHVARAMAADDPYFQKAAQLMNGEIDLNGMDKDPTYAGLPYEDREAIKTKIDAEQKAAAVEQKQADDAYRNQGLQNLFIGLAAGQFGPREIGAAYENGIIRTYDELKKANDIYKEYLGSGDDAAKMARRLQHGEIPDPTSDEDKKQGNAYINGGGGPGYARAQIQSMNDGWVDGALIPGINNLKDVPTDVVGAFEGMIGSGDPRQVGWALQTLGRLRDANKEAFERRFSAARQTDVTYYNSNQGIVPEEELLAHFGVNRTAEMQRAITAREDQAKELLKKDVTPQSAIEHFRPWGLTPNDSAIAWVRPIYDQDFSNRFVYEFSRYGDQTKALNATMEYLDKIYGISYIGTRGWRGESGVRGYVMKYPPEKVGYPEGVDGYAYIERELERLDAIAPGEVFQLVSTQGTYNDVARKDTGDPNAPMPAYLIAHQTKSGAWEVLTKDVVIDRWVDPTTGTVHPEVIKRNVVRPINFEMHESERDFVAADFNMKQAALIKQQYVDSVWGPAFARAYAEHPEDPEKYIPPDIQHKYEQLTEEAVGRVLQFNAAGAAVKSHSVAGIGYDEEGRLTTGITTDAFNRRTRMLRKDIEREEIRGTGPAVRGGAPGRGAGRGPLPPPGPAEKARNSAAEAADEARTRKALEDAAKRSEEVRKKMKKSGEPDPAFPFGGR